MGELLGPRHSERVEWRSPLSFRNVLPLLAWSACLCDAYGGSTELSRRQRFAYNPNSNSARPADTKMTWRPSTVNEIGAA
jgi:hypothetical protein